MAGTHSSDIRLGDENLYDTDMPFGDNITVDYDPWVELDITIGFALTLSLSDTINLTDNIITSAGSQAGRSIYQFRQRRI